MPSSVLWVCLVAAWLFVLVPMILKGRPQMKKTTEVAKATRVVHRGGTRARSTRRRRAAGAHPHDPSWKSGRTSSRTSTAVLDDDADRDETEFDQTDEDGVVDGVDVDVDTTVRAAADDAVAESDSTGESDESDDEVLTGEVGSDGESSADESADPITVARVEVDIVEVEVELLEDAEYEDSEYDDAEYDDEYDGDDEYEDDAEYDDAEYDDDAEYEDDAEYDDLDDDLNRDDIEPDDIEAAVDEDLEGVRRSRVAKEPDPAPEAKRNRKALRRSAYTIDASGDALRYKERQRVSLSLIVLVIAAVVCGVMVGLYGWIATGVTVLMLVGYLFYLRRTVKVEQQVRAQRIQRARRAASAEAERERREMQTPEFAAAPPPPRLRRPGGAVVLEIDDEDPVFEHLPPFRGRGVTLDDEDFRHAAVG